MPFNFPDPAVSTTATNPVTGANYQWKADPGKWVLTGGPAEAINPLVTIDLLPPEDPLKGDLWIHEETLIEYAWDGSQWFEVGSSCGGGSEGEDEKEEDIYHPFVNAYKLVAPDDFVGKAGTATIRTSAYDAGDDSYLSPEVKSIEFAARDLNNRKHELANEEDFIQLTPENEIQNGTGILYGELEVTAVTVGGYSTSYEVDFDFSRSVIYTEGDVVYYRIAPLMSNEFVKRKGGDSMEGPLNITGGRNPNVDGIESTLKVLNVDSGQSSTLNLKWDGATKVYVGENQSIFAHDIKFNTGGKAIYAEGTDKKGFVVNNNGVFYDGNYTVDRHVATKQNVEEAIFHDILDQDNTNKYVDRTGDSMTGQLEMKGSRIVFNDIPADSQVIRVNRSAGENVDLLYLAHNGGAVLGYYDIRMTGNTSYNGIRFKGGSGGEEPIFEMRANGNYNIFYSDLRFDGNRILELGDAVDDTDAVPYGQVKRELSEKFEEITATLSFGEFSYIVTSAARGDGVLSSYATATGTNGEKIPENVASLGVHHTAGDGSAVDWTSLSIGDIIRWSRGTDVWQFRVNGLPVAQDSDDMLWYQIPVNKGTGPTFIESGIGNFDYTLSILKLTGGSVDLDDYLKIDASNSPLTGNLEINQGLDNTEAALTLTGTRSNTTNSAATISFKNTNSTNIGYLTYRAYGSSQFFRFNQDVDLNNHGLHSVARIRMQAGGAISSDANERLKFKNASNANPGEGLLEVPRPVDNRRGFTIRGNDDGGAETDLLYTYTNASGPDAINYDGKMDGDSNIVNLKKIKELIASGGGDGETFVSHGPFHYILGGGSVSPGEFTTDTNTLKEVRVLTFNSKNQNGETDVWSDLAPGEVITIGQGSGDAYFIVNYMVTAIQNYSSATIVDVDAHQTFVSYSDGSVVYNPNDAFNFIVNTPTYVLESQPATLNNAVDLSNKASPGPAFGSYILDAGTGEPLLGVGKGKMISMGTSNIQTPTRFLFSSNDNYGNGHKMGANSFDCPGSMLELYRKNGDGTLCLCKVYEFSRVAGYGNNQKFEFRNLIEKHSATNNNTFFGSPGTLSAGAEYLVKYHINFTSTVYTIDAEGDPHYGDHRLEDVGHPEAATDAATKGYVDEKIASLAPDPGETVTETIENLLDFNRESILVTNITPLNLSHVTDYAPTSTVYGYFIAKSRFNRAINENILMKDGWVASKNGTMYARMYDGDGGAGGSARKLSINQVEEKTLDGVEGYYFKFSGFRPAGNNHGDFSLSGIKVTGQKGRKLTIGNAETTTPRSEYVYSYQSYKGGVGLVHDSSTKLFIPINWIHRTYGFVPLGMKDRGASLSIVFKIGNNRYTGSVPFSSVSTTSGYYGYSVDLSRSVSAYSPWNIVDFTISGITYDHVLEETSGEFTLF